MNALMHGLCKLASAACVCALLLPSAALSAPKPIGADEAREKLVKRGVGNWACVEEKSGLALCGRITTIDEQSFGLQLHNYPDVTSVFYGDVIALHFGLSGKGVAALIGGTVAAAVITGVVMHHEFEENKPQLPSTPTMPVFP